MKDYIKARTIDVANYVLENKCTVRVAAKHFNISKSTVHKDVTERLKIYNPDLCRRVKKILEKNKEERHIRGGIATREKYKKQEKSSENKYK